jgi:hypothetical protein
MTKHAAVTRRPTMVSCDDANSLASLGFGGRAAIGFVGSDVQAVVGNIGSGFGTWLGAWRGHASRAFQAPMPSTLTFLVSQPVSDTPALIETPAAELAATRRARTIGLAKAVKDADRGVEGTAQRGVPV